MNNSIIRTKEYSKHYTEDKLWNKISKFALNAGKIVINKALVLFYVAIDDQTPSWAKAIIYGALGYFILPIDAIPDFIPMVGFSDDLTALVAAFTVIQSNVKNEHKEKADLKLKGWFGK